MMRRATGYYLRKQTVLIVLFFLISIFWGGRNVMYHICESIRTPPVWDFQLFWLFGQASAQGFNPYQQENLIALARPLNTLDEMMAELYFFHAPPTLFLFAPLGWFQDIHLASAIWNLIHSAILFLVIILLWRMFTDNDILNFLLTVALVLFFSQTRNNVALGQMNFLMLLSLLLFWQDRNSARGGVWIVLGIITKPIMGILILYLLLQRQWRGIISCIVVLLIASIATVLVYGAEVFFGYFTSNPVSNQMPDFLYLEGGNQSLLGFILRAVQYDSASGSPVFYLPYLISAFIFTGLTAWVVYRLDTSNNEVALSLVIILGLLIYPKTLWHYSFILLAPLFFLWRERSILPGKTVGVGLFMALVYVIGYMRGDYVFFTVLLLWTVFLAWGIQINRLRYKEQHLFS